MKRVSKIDKVENCIVTLRNGSKWKVDSFDESTVKWWSPFDDIETESFGFDRGLYNVNKKKRVKAEEV